MGIPGAVSAALTLTPVPARRGCPGSGLDKLSVPATFPETLPAGHEPPSRARLRHPSGGITAYSPRKPASLLPGSAHLGHPRGPGHRVHFPHRGDSGNTRAHARGRLHKPAP